MIRPQTILHLVAAIGFVLSPFLSAGFNGFTADQFPVPQIAPPAQPAGYAFSIWGLIYLWLLAGAAFGLVKRGEDPGWTGMRTPLIASLLVGSAWIPVANQSPVIATVMIWIMLATGLWSLVRAGAADRLWQRTPVALYSGWLTAASSVALALLLAGYGVMSAQGAAILMITVALLIAALVTLRRPDTPEYAAAVIWALIGIIVANVATANTSIIALCAIGIVVLAYLAWRSARSS